MNKVLLIEDIENSENKTINFVFEDKIKGIDCITPIKAELCAKSFGDFVQITGHVTGKVNLECDLCLESFEYNLDFYVDELYTKTCLVNDYTNSDKEYEIKEGQFITDLDGANEIDIYDLLYQSVILNFPNKKVCGINCKGKDYLSEEKTLDPRLEIFEHLPINPKN